MIRCAGILFRAADGTVLVLRRAEGAGDCGGMWDLPGGHVEDGETLADAALRETREEIGQEFDSPGVVLTRRVLNDVDYTTFLKQVPKPFVPVLNDEHTAFAWVIPSEALAEQPPAMIPPPLEQAMTLEV